MPRTPRSPEGKAVRLTVYVTPSTKQALVDYAHQTRQSTGEVISKLALELAWKPVAPGLGKGASLPSLAGQPGVEHRAAAVSAPTPTAAVRTIETVDMSTGVTLGVSDVRGAVVTPFYDHPGWKLSATGQNVCTRCGKTKIRSKNASCVAPA